MVTRKLSSSKEPGARNRVNFMAAAYQAGQVRFCAVVTRCASQQDEGIGVPRPECGRKNRCSKPVAITEYGAWNNRGRINAVLREKSNGINSAKRDPITRLAVGNSQVG